MPVCRRNTKRSAEQHPMSKFNILIALTIGTWLPAIQGRAQVASTAPATALESIESAPDQLVFKGIVPLGTITTDSAAISVSTKQDSVLFPTNNAGPIYGCSVTFKFANKGTVRASVDEDEMDSFLHAADNIKNVTWSITSLPTFNLSYTTKAGLTISGFCSRRRGNIEFSIFANGMDEVVMLTSDQMGQFYSLLQQAKSNIDSFRKQ